MKREKGFTLIELILAILLIGIIAGFVGGMLYEESNMFSLIIPRKEAKIEGKLVMERISKEVRDAYQNTYNTGSDIKFKIPYTKYKGYTSVRLFLSQNRIFLSTDNKTPKIISENVSFFNVTSYRWQPNRDIVRIKVTSNKAGNILSQESFVYLRNNR